MTPPGPHNLMRGRLEVEEEHRLGMLLCPRHQAWGEAWLCATPRSRVAPQPGALCSALNLASPQRPMAAARVLNSQKGGLRDWYVE